MDVRSIAVALVAARAALSDADVWDTDSSPAAGGASIAVLAESKEAANAWPPLKPVPEGAEEGSPLGCT